MIRKVWFEPDLQTKFMWNLTESEFNSSLTQAVVPCRNKFYFNRCEIQPTVAEGILVDVFGDPHVGSNTKENDK